MDDSGHIQFEFGRCALRAGDGVLELTASAADEESLQETEDVIGSHLERFGARDELRVSWSR